MSNSKGEQGCYPMVVTTTAPEVSITIFDGYDQRVHSAVGGTTVDLPPGLYRVRSELRGNTEEVLVNHATTSVGFASSSDPRVHFGGPRDRSVERVTLQWPSGTSQTIERPAPNQILTVEEAPF